MEVTGKKAVYKDVMLDSLFSIGIFPDPEAKVRGEMAGNDETLFTVRENFFGALGFLEG